MIINGRKGRRQIVCVVITSVYLDRKLHSGYNNIVLRYYRYLSPIVVVLNVETRDVSYGLQ